MSKTVFYTAPDGMTYSYSRGGGGMMYGCSEERSIYCLEGPFSELFTQEPPDADGVGMCKPCAIAAGWPVDQLLKRGRR